MSTSSTLKEEHLNIRAARKIQTVHLTRLIMSASKDGSEPVLYDQRVMKPCFHTEAATQLIRAAAAGPLLTFKKIFSSPTPKPL